ncbi:fused DSP-PTPase phosphatase/NAD kinase-like protein [Pseudidiomarina donghaiensis]|uniref:DSP-PTPase phosphatase fused to NAD+ Kinase domain-containing protein n=1 Tax=Pseudidiomarina donghaiensis TaxID=519452 RepID=A0A432XIT7_9GAMM|nr:protein tyrosine phosphatase family protein [Pseudidiomarina donghaiensis]RUO48536.1 hypothetical protein CWE24_07080 [Pseudidiomarina donghaiensis]SFV23903.1 TIGR01244 family protein [Pseudidiomarina donghaiensis]
MRFLSALSASFVALVLLSGCNQGEPSVNSIPVEVADVSNIHHPNTEHFTAGQPTEAQLATFAELGVTTVVNLRGEQEMADINEAQWTNNLGMRYYHLPVAGGDDLTRENVAEFHRIMSANEGEKTLLHCASSNRVGAMMALRAAWFQGASKQEALVKGQEYGMRSLAPMVEKLLSE